MYGGHPLHRRSVRWWVAQSPVPGLLLGFLLLMAALSIGLAVLYLVSEDDSRPALYRNRPQRLAWLALTALRALLGLEAFPRQPDNAVHEVLAIAASLIGWVMPALIIGIVVVRIFTVRVVEWRRRVSVCLAAELDGDLFEKVADKRHAYLAVRWYKRLDNLSVTNLQADAYLRCRTVSHIDGSALYRYQPLNVLGLNGAEGATCTWPETFSGMPFTLWIPLHAPLDRGRITEIQGRVLDDGDDRQLVVRLSGQVARPVSQISEERRYHLLTDVQVGRFVPIEPNLAAPARTWPGWRRFEEGITHSVFVYGSLADPDELLALLGGWPGEQDVRRAELTGFARSWRVCVDNTDPARVATYVAPGHTGDPDGGGPAPVQVLFPTVLPSPAAVTVGLLVRVAAEQLAMLDARHPEYDRLRVTRQIRVGSAGGLPDVVWTYVGRPRSVSRADAAVAAGTARISRQYLNRLRRALAAHGPLLEAFSAEPLPDSVPIEDLVPLPPNPAALVPVPDQPIDRHTSDAAT